MKRILVSLSVIAVVGAIVVGGTVAFFSDTATSTGNTFTSGNLDLKLSNKHDINYGDSVTATWNVDKMAPGGTPYVSTLYMKNVGSIDADYLKFVTEDTDIHPDGMDEQVRITELSYAGKSLLTGGAGADLSNYVAPTYCDVTVGSTTDLQNAINNAINNADADIVICVSPATYEKITIPAVGFDITLASTDGPETTIIDAGNSGNGITVNGGTGTVTIEGFTIQSYGEEGILVDGGSVDILNNVIKANGDGTPKGFPVDSIYTKGEAIVTVTHNDLGNNQYTGNVQTGNPDPGAWSTAAGLSVHDSCNVTAEYNHIYGSDFGIHVKDSTAILTANYNDVLGNTRDFFFEANEADGGTCTPSTPFNVTNNWWGDFIPANHVSVASKCAATPISEIVNYTPYAGGPFIGYINGKDYNGNHFADLNDFYGVTGSCSSCDKNPLVVENPDLKASGDPRALIMGVQLDGPTTGNDFKDGNVNMTMTITMGQGPAQ